MGGQPEPVAGQTTSDTRSKTVAKDITSGAADVQKTLPSWLSNMLQGQAVNYGQTTADFSDMIKNWQAAGFSPDQLAGFEAQRQAVGPGGAIPQSLEQLQSTAAGDFLTGPGRDEQIAAITRSLSPGVTSLFGGSGRDQNFLGAENLARGVSDSYLSNVFNPERQRMMAAQQLIPGQALLPGQTLQDIGSQYQQLAQYGINTPLSFLPQLGAMQLGATGFADPFTGQKSTTSGTSRSVTNQTGSGSGTTLPPYFPGSNSPFGAMLAGAGMGGQIGGPWGALAGAAGGGLLSAFG